MRNLTLRMQELGKSAIHMETEEKWNSRDVGVVYKRCGDDFMSVGIRKTSITGVIKGREKLLTKRTKGGKWSTRGYVRKMR